MEWWGHAGMFGGGYSTAAQDYINRVIAADVAAGNTLGLEVGVQNAYAVFIDGLIADGLLGTSGGVISQASSVIKAACIMAGAQTVSGCLVPLVGTAPTNNGFTSADYNRKTGLIGNASSKYLDSNRANNADPQNSQHMAVWQSTAPTGDIRAYMGDLSGSNAGRSYFYRFAANAIAFSSRVTSEASTGGVTPPPSSMLGMSRTSSSSYTYRLNSTTYTATATSATPTTGNIHIFRLNRTSGNFVYSDPRLGFYSIGEGLALATLNARLSTLFADLAAAIP